MIEFDLKKGTSIPGVTLKVLGVGGAGSNMVNSMISCQYEGIEYIVANTDAQALKNSSAQHKIQLGAKATRGLGCGANPDFGKRSAEEDIDKIAQIAEGADVLFLVAGMGGGTGSGALPVIAQALKGADVLTIAIVTKPFLFEGKRRMNVAQDAIAQLQKDLDTLLVVPNQKLLEVVDSSASMIDAFEMINELLGESVKSIADIISKSGLINVDFADLRTVMKDRGKAVMATGRASGNDRATQAAMRAITSPLLENMSIDGARGLLLNVAGGKSLGIHEISAAASMIHEAVHEDANIILGSVIDESLGEDIVVTVIATGFESELRSQMPSEQSQIEQSQIEQPQVEQVVSKNLEFDASVIDAQQVKVKPSIESSFEAKKEEASEFKQFVKPQESVTICVENKDLAVKEEVKEEVIEKKAESVISMMVEDAKEGEASFDSKDLDAPTYLRKSKEKRAD